jgi:hypothetical protein
VPCECVEACSGLGRPELHRLIGAPAREHLSVGAPIHGQHIMAARYIGNRQQHPLAGDRPLAVVSNRYTSNGLSICPFSPPSRLIHAGDSICDVPVPGQHLRTAAVFSAPDAHCLVIAPRCQEAAVGTPGHRTYIVTANFSYIGNRQQRPLAGDRALAVASAGFTYNGLS